MPHNWRPELGVEPLERVVLGEDRPVLGTATAIFFLLRVNAVKLRDIAAVAAGGEGSEVNVRRTRLWQGGNLDFAKQVNAVRGDSNADFFEVVIGEAGEVLVAQVRLYYGSATSKGQLSRVVGVLG